MPAMINAFFSPPPRFPPPVTAGALLPDVLKLVCCLHVACDDAPCFPSSSSSSLLAAINIDVVMLACCTATAISICRLQEIRGRRYNESRGPAAVDHGALHNAPESRRNHGIQVSSTMHLLFPSSSLHHEPFLSRTGVSINVRSPRQVKWFEPEVRWQAYVRTS